MNKQLIQAVKGTRDFYPEDKAFQNWLYQIIKKISERYGYQEFDGPEIEYLDLYSDKTSEEILSEQVFILKDRDNRKLALRPELTPTFARMVAQKSQQLIKPVRWYSFGRAWRYEQPQKGRGREFYQWEINILGPETPEADAEILAIAADYFKELGLTPKEVIIRVNDRSYFEQILEENSISKELFLPLLRLIDRIEKISDSEFKDELVKLNLDDKQIEGINSYINNKNDFSKSEWLTKLFGCLKNYSGALDYIKFDPTIARGFDYYTRTVFEAFDITGNVKRALFGGGRFDNLTATLGGERVPGMGMAPGDMPIKALLEDLNKMPTLVVKKAKVLVTTFNENLINKSLEVSSKLREENIDTECWVEPTSKLDKQIRYADQKEIPYVVIIGPDEAELDQVTLKNLNEQSQEKLSLEDLITKLS